MRYLLSVLVFYSHVRKWLIQMRTKNRYLLLSLLILSMTVAGASQVTISHHGLDFSNTEDPFLKGLGFTNQNFSDVLSHGSSTNSSFDINGNSIMDNGSKSIDFNGSQDVKIPNGNLSLNNNSILNTSSFETGNLLLKDFTGASSWNVNTSQNNAFSLTNMISDSERLSIQNNGPAVFKEEGFRVENQSDALFEVNSSTGNVNISEGNLSMENNSVKNADVIELSETNLSSCNSNTEGEIRYNGTAHYGCNGTSWNAMY